MTFPAEYEILFSKNLHFAWCGMGEEHIMELSLDAFMARDAREVCSWRYPAPYDIYNEPDWDEVVRLGWEMADPAARREEFRSLKADGVLAGFVHLHRQADCVMLGMGLRPDLCGLGLGAHAMALALAEAARRYPGVPLRLEVRTFNDRARKCYEKAGFSAVDRYTRATPLGEGEFFLMEKTD